MATRHEESPDLATIELADHHTALQSLHRVVKLANLRSTEATASIVPFPKSSPVLAVNFDKMVIDRKATFASHKRRREEDVLRKWEDDATTIDPATGMTLRELQKKFIESGSIGKDCYARALMEPGAVPDYEKAPVFHQSQPLYSSMNGDLLQSYYSLSHEPRVLPLSQLMNPAMDDPFRDDSSLCRVPPNYSSGQSRTSTHPYGADAMTSTACTAYNQLYSDYGAEVLQPNVATSSSMLGFYRAEDYTSPSLPDPSEFISPSGFSPRVIEPTSSTGRVHETIVLEDADFVARDLALPRYKKKQRRSERSAESAPYHRPSKPSASSQVIHPIIQLSPPVMGRPRNIESILVDSSIIQKELEQMFTCKHIRESSGNHTGGVGGVCGRVFTDVGAFSVHLAALESEGGHDTGEGHSKKDVCRWQGCSNSRAVSGIGRHIISAHAFRWICPFQICFRQPGGKIKAFKRSDALESHMTKAHEVTDEEMAAVRERYGKYGVVVFQDQLPPDVF